MNLEQAERFKTQYMSFINLTSELITFIKNHQFIQGFQIQTSEFYKSDSKTIISIDEYITILKQAPNEKEENYETLDLSPDELHDLEELESAALKERESNEQKLRESNEQKISNPLNLSKTSEVSLEKQESNQKTKEDVARLVGSNISPLKKKSGHGSSKIRERKWTKPPLIVLGMVKTEEKAIEENLKNKYKGEVLATEAFQKETNISGDLAEPHIKRFESDLVGIHGGKRKSRKESMGDNERPSKIMKVDFEPDFDRKIYDTFLNGYSHMFSMKALLGESKSGTHDDSVMNKIYNAKNMFF